MSQVDAIVGMAVAGLVETEFRRTRPDTGGAPGVRLTGFREGEIRHIAEQLVARDLRVPGGEKPAQIVVGSRVQRPGFPQGVFLQPTWTLTRHRNENDHGLVLIELDAQGDQNGIRAMHTLSDSDLLSHDDADLVRSRVRSIGPIAWQVASPEVGVEAPDSLLDALQEVFESLSGAKQLALRTWVTYSAAVAELLAPTARSVSGPEARAAAAEQLGHLNLFPDPQLFDKPGLAARRLKQNAYMSEMRTPQGRDIPDDQLGTLIDTVVLREVDGVELPGETTNRLRQDMRRVLDAGGPEFETAVEFRFWEQLFERRRVAIGLGTQVRGNLEIHHSERLEEFESLRVQDGLDDGESDAALDLLRNDTPSSDLSLVDCLDPALRRKVERLAFQGERVEPDPLIALLYGLNAIETDRDTNSPPVVTLEWEAATQTATRSARLFAFLYRNTLADVEEACDGSIGARLVVADEIKAIPPLGDLFIHGDTYDDDAEELVQREWSPLRFRVSQAGSGTPLLRFRWDPRSVPGLAAFAYTITAGGVSERLSIPPLDEWCDAVLEASWSPELNESIGGPSDELGEQWTELAREHFAIWSQDGLSVGGMDAFLTGWAPIIEEATLRYVPKGGAVAELDAFLDHDTALTTEGRHVMLACHPLRLRWLRHHLEHLGTYIRDSLLGELRLNPENDRVFFQWIERVSPHRQPPLMSPGSQQLATSVREVQLHEEYALVPSNDDRRADWLGALDSASIDELVSTTRSFLAAFPHKIEGLSVLLMATSGSAGTARRFVEQLRYRDLAGLDLELHVVTPSIDHDDVAAELSKLDSDEGRGQRLLPPFRLLLHGWESGVPECFEELRGRVDVALAPNLFGLHSTALEETRRHNPGIGGRFDPWIDPTTYTRPTDEGTINVSQVLLPVSPDPLLQDWSTLTVRRRRQAPVSAEDPESIDFVTLQVAFDKNEALFSALHSVANWVITLDPFVGRDQIDALKDAPDVIVVKSDIGKNENNTLVVSSNAGRAWVEAQLARRLTRDFVVHPSRAEAIAARLYDIGRNVVPGLMLRALGLGRTTEEILGLILARYAVDHFDPEPAPRDGTEYWVSLDEHTNWFGGPNRMRPDLLRVRLTIDEGVTRLNLLVLESKFRRHFDLGAAEEQVDGGLRLVDAAFGAGGVRFDDAMFWRRELLTAIGELSHRPAPAWSMPAVLRLDGDADEAALFESLRAGEFSFGGATAIVAATNWADGTGPGEAIGHTPSGHPLLHLDRVTALRLLDRIEQELEPRQPDTDGPESETSSPHTAPRSGEELRGSSAIADDSGRRLPPPTGPARVDPGVMPPMRFDDDADMKSDRIGPESSVGLEREQAPVRGLPIVVLENRYGRILGKLDQLGVEVNRPTAMAFQEGPGFCLYRVVPRSGVSADRVMGKLGDLKLALELPAELNIRAYVDKGTVVFEVPKEDPDRYFVSAEALWKRSVDSSDRLSVPIGEDIEGDVVELDFSSSDTPHLLIAGQTGSGKSIALETILTGLCRQRDPDQLQLLLVDPKGTELLGLEGEPHVRGEIGWDAADALEKLREGTNEMNRRYELFRAQRARTLAEFNAKVEHRDRLPWWLIVLDEYADLTSDADDRKAIEVVLKRIAQKGRAAGVHLIVATQKPSAEVISTVVRSNLPAQLALRVKSAIDSRIIMEESGAESLSGKGDAFLRTARGLQRLQCAKVD